MTTREKVSSRGSVQLTAHNPNCRRWVSFPGKPHTENSRVVDDVSLSGPARSRAPAHNSQGLARQNSLDAVANERLHRVLRSSDLGKSLALGFSRQIGLGQKQHIGGLDLRPFIGFAVLENAGGVQGIDQANHAVQSQRSLSLVSGQFVDNICRVPRAARFYEQASRF
jgi:hypothetical protein